MKVGLINSTPFPLVAMGSAAAITRGIPYREFIKETSTLRERSIRLLTECYEAGHWSVFEFSDWDIEGEGVSRVFETQCVRSRLCSFEYSSGRVGQDYEPCEQAQKDPDIEAAVNETIAIYETLISMGKVPEEARYAVGQGVYRMGRIKRNFRNLMETSMIRLCSHAQTEYREFMYKCKELVSEYDPFLGSLLVPKCKIYMFCNERRNGKPNSCGLDNVLTKEQVKEAIKIYKVLNTPGLIRPGVYADLAKELAEVGEGE